MNNIKEILEKIYINEELRKTIVPLFISNPGQGKSSIISQFAKEKGVNIVELITSQMSPFEISGISIPSHELKKMVYYNFDRLDNLKDGDILFFDELLNGNPTVLNACLTVLEQRTMISGTPLPNIMIVAAANPQNQVPLSPQIKERFVWYDIEYNEKNWLDFMYDKHRLPDTIGKKLSKLIKDETFTSKNFYTPRSIDKAVNMIIHNCFTPYEKIIKPILSELIKNTFDQDVDLGNGEILAVNEMVSWLKLIQLNKKNTY
jgi:MoxR-like ATPase